LTLDFDQTNEYVEQLDKDVKNIRKEVAYLTWSMRGGLQYTDCMNMSQDERTVIADLAKDNLETTKKSQLPYF